MGTARLTTVIALLLGLAAAVVLVVTFGAEGDPVPQIADQPGAATSPDDEVVGSADPGSVALDDGFVPSDGDRLADDRATVVGSVEELTATDPAALPAPIHGIAAVSAGEEPVLDPLATVTLRPHSAEADAVAGTAPPVVGGVWLPDGRLVAGDVEDRLADALVVSPSTSPGGDAEVARAGESFFFGVGGDPIPDRIVGVHATTGELLVVADEAPLTLVARDLDAGTSRELATITEPSGDGAAASEADAALDRREIAAAHAVDDAVVVLSAPRSGAFDTMVLGQDAAGELPSWLHLGSEGEELEALRPVNATWPTEDLEDLRLASAPQLVPTDDGPVVATAEHAAVGPLEVVLTDATGDTRVALRLDETRHTDEEPPIFRYASDRPAEGPITSFAVHDGQVLITGADPVDAAPGGSGDEEPMASSVADREVIGTSLILDLSDGSVTRLDDLAGPTLTGFAPLAGDPDSDG